MTTVAKNPQKKMFGSMANPVLRRMEKNAECAATNSATYGGVTAKTIYFLLVTIAGVFLAFILHNILIQNSSSILFHVEDTKNGIYDLTMATGEAVIVGIAALISLITPFLAWLVRKTIPITGTLYSASQGIFIGYITIALVPQYRYISLLAMIITLALVLVMLFIYAKRIITVTARFRGIVAALFFGIILAGLFYFLISLIPAVHNSGVFAGINNALNQPVVSIIISIVFIIIASLFMLADFDTIERCVTNQVDKKYEWMAAWGLAYTILFIYFKVLRILLTLLGGRSSNS